LLGLGAFGLQLREIRSACFRLPPDALILEVVPRRPVNDAAERLHPAVERHHRVLLHLSEDRALTRRQLTGHRLDEIQAAPEVEGVAPAAHQPPSGGAQGCHGWPPNQPDQTAEQGAGGRSERSFSPLLLHRHISGSVLNDQGPGVNGQGVFLMKLLEGSYPLMGFVLVRKDHNDELVCNISSGARTSSPRS
jgi:hypothetical protein